MAAVSFRTSIRLIPSIRQFRLNMFFSFFTFLITNWTFKLIKIIVLSQTGVLKSICLWLQMVYFLTRHKLFHSNTKMTSFVGQHFLNFVFKIGLTKKCRRGRSLAIQLQFTTTVVLLRCEDKTCWEIWESHCRKFPRRKLRDEIQHIVCDIKIIRTTWASQT